MKRLDCFFFRKPENRKQCCSYSCQQAIMTTEVNQYELRTELTSSFTDYLESLKHEMVVILDYEIFSVSFQFPIFSSPSTMQH